MLLPHCHEVAAKAPRQAIECRWTLARTSTEDVPDVIIHRMNHNLDGQWLNIYFTDSTGDWVRSIHKDGNHEETQ